MRRDFISDNGQEIMITTAEFADGWFTIIEDLTGRNISKAYRWADEETAMKKHEQGVCLILGCGEDHPPNEHVDMLVKQRRAAASN